MSDLTTEGLVEAMARALYAARYGGLAVEWEKLSAPRRAMEKAEARAALAAVAKAAGTFDALDLAGIDLCPIGPPDEDTPAEADNRRVAALLRALAGAANG